MNRMIAFDRPPSRTQVWRSMICFHIMLQPSISLPAPTSVPASTGRFERRDQRHLSWKMATPSRSDNLPTTSSSLRSPSCRRSPSPSRIRRSLRSGHSDSRNLSRSRHSVRSLATLSFRPTWVSSRFPCRRRRTSPGSHRTSLHRRE